MGATKAVAPLQVRNLTRTRILNELGVSHESRHEPDFVETAGRDRSSRNRRATPATGVLGRRLSS